jgi:hypothetical protein
MILFKNEKDQVVFPSENGHPLLPIITQNYLDAQGVEVVNPKGEVLNLFTFEPLKLDYNYLNTKNE